MCKSSLIQDFLSPPNYTSTHLERRWKSDLLVGFLLRRLTHHQAEINILLEDKCQPRWYHFPKLDKPFYWRRSQLTWSGPEHSTQQAGIRGCTRDGPLLFWIVHSLYFYFHLCLTTQLEEQSTEYRRSREGEGLFKWKLIYLIKRREQCEIRGLGGYKRSGDPLIASVLSSDQDGDDQLVYSQLF